MATTHPRHPLPTLGLFLVVVAGFAGGRASEAAAPPSTPEQASFRISMENGIGGSCTAVHPRVALSNAHVSTRIGLRCRITNTVSGVTATGRCFARDPTADLALILLDSPVQYVRVNTRGIEDSGELRRFAYGGSGRFVKIVCRLLGRERNDVNPSVNVMWASLSYPSVSGDSGGGTYNSRGELVATLHRTGGGRTLATETTYLVAMVQQYDAKHGSDLKCKLFGH